MRGERSTSALSGAGSSYFLSPYGQGSSLRAVKSYTMIPSSSKRANRPHVHPTEIGLGGEEDLAWTRKLKATLRQPPPPAARTLEDIAAVTEPLDDSSRLNVTSPRSILVCLREGVDPVSLLPRDVYGHNEVERLAKEKMEARRRKAAKEKLKQLLAHREMLTDDDVLKLRAEFGALTTKDTNAGAGGAAGAGVPTAAVQLEQKFNEIKEKVDVEEQKAAERLKKANRMQVQVVLNQDRETQRRMAARAEEKERLAKLEAKRQNEFRHKDLQKVEQMRQQVAREEAEAAHLAELEEERDYQRKVEKLKAEEAVARMERKRFQANRVKTEAEVLRRVAHERRMAEVQKQWEESVMKRVSERHRRAEEATARLMAEQQAERLEKNAKVRKAFIERREKEKQKEAEDIKQRELRFFQRQASRNRRRAEIEYAQAEDIKHRSLMNEALQRKAAANRHENDEEIVSWHNHLMQEREQKLLRAEAEIDQRLLQERLERTAKLAADEELHAEHVREINRKAALKSQIIKEKIHKHDQVSTAVKHAQEVALQRRQVMAVQASAYRNALKSSMQEAWRQNMNQTGDGLQKAIEGAIADVESKKDTYAVKPRPFTAPPKRNRRHTG